MALQPYTVTLPRGQEHLLPSPMKRRRTVTTTTTGGLSRAAQRLFGKALEQFEPGGAFGKGVEAALERGRTKAVAGGQQALARAGLTGTTMMAAPGQRFEEEIAMPTRAKAEETRVGRLADVYTMLAQMSQQAYESEQERGLRTPIMPQIRQIRPTTKRNVSVVPRPTSSDFSLPISNRLASTTQRLVTPQVTFGEPIMGASEEWRAKQPEWVTGAGTPTPEQIDTFNNTFGPPTPYYEAGGGWTKWR